MHHSFFFCIFLGSEFKIIVSFVQMIGKILISESRISTKKISSQFSNFYPKIIKNEYLFSVDQTILVDDEGQFNPKQRPAYLPKVLQLHTLSMQKKLRLKVSCRKNLDWSVNFYIISSYNSLSAAFHLYEHDPGLNVS